MSQADSNDMKNKFDILINEMWNKGDYSKINTIISDKYTLFSDPGDPWDGKTIDHKMFIERMNGSRKIFPDQNFRIENIFISNDKLAANWYLNGTQKGDLPGLPATNKRIKVPGMTIYYFENGLIIGHWQVFDHVVLMSQLKAT